MSSAEVRCPFCGSDDLEPVSAWGSQIITRQVRCRSCNTYFEAIRDEFEDEGDPPAGPQAA
jgi:hypothetical protein